MDLKKSLKEHSRGLTLETRLNSQQSTKIRNTQSWGIKIESEGTEKDKNDIDSP